MVREFRSAAWKVLQRRCFFACCALIGDDGNLPKSGTGSRKWLVDMPIDFSVIK